MDEHVKYMTMALDIAFDYMGRTSPNPSVGAVVVKNGVVVGTGGTQPHGSHHAEVMALQQAGDAAQGGTLYVSLEPCCHFGKTPPCVNAILHAGIKEVFVSVLDPNPLVAGKGISWLGRAGVRATVLNELSHAGADLLRPFKKHILRRRPFVTHKCATTLDGKIATASGDSRWISSPQSRYLAHKLRAKVDAVIVGKHTLVHDNPQLSVRFDDFEASVRASLDRGNFAVTGKRNFFLESLISREIAHPRNPLRVAIGLPHPLDPSLKIFADRTHLIFERKSALDRMIREQTASAHTLAGVNLVELNAGSPAEETIEIQEELGKRGIMFVMLEGGAGIAGSYFDAGEIDHFLYVLAPRVAGCGLSPVCGEGVTAMAQALPLHDRTIVTLDDDLLYSGYRERYNFELM